MLFGPSKLSKYKCNLMTTTEAENQYLEIEEEVATSNRQMRNQGLVLFEKRFHAFICNFKTFILVSICFIKHNTNLMFYEPHFTTLLIKS